MLAEMPAKTFLEWMLYYQVEPFGEGRADLRAGIVASTIAEVNRDRKKRQKAYTAADFMPQFEKEERPPQSWEEQLAIAQLWASATVAGVEEPNTERADRGGHVDEPAHQAGD